MKIENFFATSRHAMNVVEFERALSRTRIRSRRAIEGARLLMVHGISSDKAGAAVGISGSYIRRIRRNLLRAHKHAIGVPIDWAVVTVVVPFDECRTIKQWEKKIHHRSGVRLR